MRTTIDLPDELLQQARTEAQRRGIPLRELFQEGLRKVLPTLPSAPENASPSPTLYELMKDGFGCVDAGVDDLGSNPEYLKNLGKDSMGNR